MVAVIVSSLFGAIAIPVSAAGEVTVTRSYVQGTTAGTANVTVIYTVNSAIASLAIKENIPTGWDISDQTSDPLCMYNANTHEWVLPIPGVSEIPAVGDSGTITYTVSGPAGATSTISGGYNTGEGYVDTPSTEVTLKGGGTEATLTPSPTPSSTPSPSPLVTSTPSLTVTPTASPTATATSTPHVTPTPSPSPGPTATPTTAAPTPPGFETVFAIVGLLVVAFLVLRGKRK